jgi:glycosidase
MPLPALLRRTALLLTLALLLASCQAQEAPEPPPETPLATVPTREAGSRDTDGWDNEWARGAVFYEIFVRSFADSDGDGIGDLPGLTAHLDDLASGDGDPANGSGLGVEGLWLMPVFRSPSYHGYDTTDYRRINPVYGTEEDFDRFLAEAHRRGLEVILDLMINHTSSQHPWFYESAALPESPRGDWYVWRSDDPGWTQPWGGTQPTWHAYGDRFYYGLFWRGMPDLNFRNREVREEIKDIATFWLDRGVDGFRLDAARHITAAGPGQEQNDTAATHSWWKEFSAHVRRTHPEALLLGENWTDAATIATYYGSTAAVAGGDELPMNFDFPVAAAIVEAVKTGDVSLLAAALAEKARLFPPGALSATFLTNHDMPRLAAQLDRDRGRLGAAAAVLLTLPGTPFLYYGEEVGLADGPGLGDEPKRTPMPWTGGPGGGFTAAEIPWYPFAAGRETANVAAQKADPESLWHRYRELIRLRRSSPALRLGGLEVLSPEGNSPSPGPNPVLAFLRRLEPGDQEQAVLVVHNLSGEAVTAGPFAVEFPAGGEALFGDPGVQIRRGEEGLLVDLPAWACGVWGVGGE